MMCIVCAARAAKPTGSLCGPCGASLDKHVDSDAGDALGLILWAARRARRYAKRQARR